MEVAAAINNAGQITGWGTVADAASAFLLTPIDQPLGDLDNDCTVGLADFSCTADLDGDGIAGIIDFLILLANWSS